jgi:hypothetical protein
MVETKPCVSPTSKYYVTQNQAVFLGSNVHSLDLVCYDAHRSGSPSLYTTAICSTKDRKLLAEGNTYREMEKSRNPN